jgi:hypothetical protein
MASMWFEPTIPVFERVRTVHALERAATVIANLRYDTENLTPGSEVF